MEQNVWLRYNDQIGSISVHIPISLERWRHDLRLEFIHSVLAWRIPGTGEPGGLPSMGSHRVGHD